MKKVLVAIAASLVFGVVGFGCGGDRGEPSGETVSDSAVDSTTPIPTTPTGGIDLCSLASKALPGSADEPATNVQLAESLTERASILMRVAESSSGELAKALRLSGDAMTRLSEAVASETDPNALDGLLTELSSDVDFAEAQELIDEAVSIACTEGDQ